MLYLILVSVIWAFSFGLIRVSFGSVDPVVLAFLRLSMATVVFLPFLRGNFLHWRERTSLMGIGAIQYGAMYALLFSAFPFVGPRSYLIALFTLTTPIFVLLFATWLENRLSGRAWLAASLAVLGAAIIQWKSGLGENFWIAFFLLQGSNAAFAFGQIAYRRVRSTIKQSAADREIFPWVFIGAALFTGALTLSRGGWRSIDELGGVQWLTLLYLGVIASGLAFFWWNLGATKVTPPTLAVMNNLKVPLTVLVSLIVFQEWRTVNWPQTLAGTFLIAAALVLCSRPDRSLFRPQNEKSRNDRPPS